MGMQTTKARGRPRGNKVHYQARLTPEEQRLVDETVARCRGMADPEFDKQVKVVVDEVSGQIKALLDDIERLTLENENLQSQIEELQAGVTDQVVQELRFRNRQLEQRVRQLESLN